MLTKGPKIWRTELNKLDFCLTVHHQLRKDEPTRCNNDLLICKISWTCFGQYFAHHQERETEIFIAYGILLLWWVGRRWAAALHSIHLCVSVLFTVCAQTPVYLTWILLQVCATCRTPRLNMKFDLRPSSNNIHDTFPTGTAQDTTLYMYSVWHNYRGAEESLARPGRKQATATEDFDVQISYS